MRNNQRDEIFRKQKTFFEETYYLSNLSRRQQTEIYLL